MSEKKRTLRYRSFHSAIISLLLIAGALLIPLGALAGQDYAPWLLIDTKRNKIAVMKGLKPVRTFENISIGRGGTSHHRTNGDKTTPIGEYSIAWISDSERYHKFLGFSYPTLRQAAHALDENKISAKTFSRIKKALDEGRLPPQDTELGGNLGIHGIGASDRSIHDSFNWTNGCVALTDEQLDELSKSVGIGTPVIIR